MGNCCGKRRFPYASRVMGQRCSSQASSNDDEEENIKRQIRESNRRDNNNNELQEKDNSRDRRSKSNSYDGSQRSQNPNHSTNGVGIGGNYGINNTRKSSDRDTLNDNNKCLVKNNNKDANNNSNSKSFRDKKQSKSSKDIDRDNDSNYNNNPNNSKSNLDNKSSKKRSSNNSLKSTNSRKKKKDFDKNDNNRKSNKKGSAINYNFHDDNHKNNLKQRDSLKSSSSDSSIGSNLQFIQHIRDREEPEEIDATLHPFDLSAPQTFFLQKALEDKRKLTATQGNKEIKGGSMDAIAKVYRYKKYSSCSNMVMDDSTLSRPNQKAMVKCVALALYYHIRHRRVDKTGKNFYPLFDEKQHPLSKEKVPDDYYKREPDHKAIYKFLRQLFTSAQLNAECAIIMLVYLERIMSYGELRIDPSNWKRLLLGSVLLASKVWDDQAVWNVDYCQILKELTVEDMNALERHYLDLLQFNINIGSSIYAKYYFDLRHLAVHAGLIFNTHPLTKKRATKLDASNRLHFQKNREHRASHILPAKSKLANLNTTTLQQQQNQTQTSNQSNSKQNKNNQNVNYLDYKNIEKVLLHRSHSCDEHLEKRIHMYVFS